MTVTVLQCQLMEHRIGANYFILGKLMQANDTKDTSHHTQKCRTDISMNSSGKPQFIKNKMHFQNFDSLNSNTRITLELQLYIAPQNADNDVHAAVGDKLLSESIFLGTATHSFTSNFVQLMKSDYETVNNNNDP